MERVLFLSNYVALLACLFYFECGHGDDDVLYDELVSKDKVELAGVMSSPRGFVGGS